MGDKKDLEKPDALTNDPELDELLNSALEDFSKKPSTTTTTSTNKNDATAAATTPPATTTTTATTNAENPESLWTDEFIKQAASQFETNMQNFLGGSGQEITPEQLQQNFQRMAEAAAQVMANPSALEPTPESNNFAETITQTLQNLSLGTENLQNPFSEQDIMSMFGGGGVGGVGGIGGIGGIGGVGAPIVEGSGGAGNAFLPFMQGMMQSLLSKEVLYPSLKDILDKYPDWLNENKSKLDESEIERYTKQMNLMKDVCTELDQEKDDDAETVKRERFDRVLQLMQKMQDLGHPPAELVDAGGVTLPGLGGGIQFDAQGNPVLPADFQMPDPNQCLIM